MILSLESVYTNTKRTGAREALPRGVVRSAFSAWVSHSRRHVQSILLHSLYPTCQTVKHKFFLLSKLNLFKIILIIVGGGRTKL